VAPGLAASAEAVTDTAASGGTGGAAASQRTGASAIASLGPGEVLDLGVTYYGQKVRGSSAAAGLGLRVAR
jgi:hypothetical protein